MAYHPDITLRIEVVHRSEILGSVLPASNCGSSGFIPGFELEVAVVVAGHIGMIFRTPDDAVVVHADVGASCCQHSKWHEAPCSSHPAPRYRFVDLQNSYYGILHKPRAYTSDH